MTLVLPLYEVFAGDDGVEIILNTGKDLTAATLPQIVGRNPRGAPIAWAGDIYTVDTKTQFIRYVTGPNDLLEAGEYKIQTRFKLGAWHGRGHYFRFKVEA